MSKLLAISLWISLCFLNLHAETAVNYPGPQVGKAMSLKTDNKYILSNRLIKASWQIKNGTISAADIVNKSSLEKLGAGKQLFAVALKKQVIDTDWVYLGIKVNAHSIDALLSTDGHNWSSLGNIPKNAFTAKPALIRVGKVDNKGGERDYSTNGPLGICEFLSVQAVTTSGKILSLTGKPKRIHKSAAKGTELIINNELGKITAAPHTTAFSEYAVPSDCSFFTCRLKKGTDTGQTWGPGLTLVDADGKFVTLGIRSKGLFNLNSLAGNKIIGLKIPQGLNCTLSSNQFKASRIKTKQSNIGATLNATLAEVSTGIKVKWQAELRNDSNYIRQTFTFSGKKELSLYGLELLSFKADEARQVGQVPGSPVATRSFFCGLEMPVTSNFMSAAGFRSGFACYLPITRNSQYKFTSLAGVYPKGQLRRAFNYYLERERASKSKQLLHYNNWYDFAPEDKKFIQVIKEYGKELTEKRGVKIDSFVIDDGWDHYGDGLWTFHRKRFPQGFTNVTREAHKIGSNLGVWISPLGGYSGANERTEHARKMGLIKDQLDLSQPGYYKWYRDKCLDMMRKYKVNYFKWDKAGSGVDPHFMALLRVAEELKKEKADLFLNVTVGTWPSPFWLNHIDCTWRNGSGDVAWHGKGDKRESWLTFRDKSCYQIIVQRAPLYPINSLMHHGLVLGHHYQGKDVAKAGADLKNAARSYFAMGPNLQELYLSTDLMTQKSWNQVAEAAKWSKRNKDILVDSHWIGGDPGKGEVYGCAAWREDKATLFFRNPDDVVKTITIDIAEAFELPKKAATRWKLKNAYSDQQAAEVILEAGKKHTFTLKPFEVVVFDAKAL